MVAVLPPATCTSLLLQALVDLTLLNFEPSIEQATHVRQALPVFFEHFAQLHQQHHAILATALLPAARRWVVASHQRPA